MINEIIFKQLRSFGVMIGAAMATRFSKISRHETFISFNFYSILACLISCVNTYITAIIGRFFYGITAGVLMSLIPQMLMETIPIDIYEKYGYGILPTLVTKIF